MQQSLIIRLPFERKVQIHFSTYQAIQRAARIYTDDGRVASYAAAPHEGLTSEVVAAVRKRMISRGELPKRCYSRRGDQA